MSFEKNLSTILEEIGSALAEIVPQRVEELVQLILAAPAIFVTGQGRSGLVARLFAMRLMHLGLSGHVAGEIMTPRFNPGELLIAVSRTGETSIPCTLADAALAAGGTVAAVTANPAGHLAMASRVAVIIPKHGTHSPQYGGSAFEQAALLLLEAVVMELRQRLGRTEAEMDARHANLE